MEGIPRELERRKRFFLQERCRVDIDKWGRIFCPELLGHSTFGRRDFNSPKMVESLIYIDRIKIIRMHMENYVFI